MRVTMHVEVEFEVGTPMPNRDRVRDALLQRFKGAGATDARCDLIVKAVRDYTGTHYNTPLHLRAIRLPRGAERAPAAYIRIEE